MKNIANGMKRLEATGSVDDVVRRLTTLISSKNIHLFCIIDHSAEAREIGMTMPDTKLLIFGDPRSGTPLMIAAPSIAIDLPLKILVAQEKDGPVVISYNTPDYLLKRHDLPEELMRNISAIEALAKAACMDLPMSPAAD